MTQKLKPCPFCNSAPTSEPWHGGSPSKIMISCSEEDCDVNPKVTGETPSEAAAAWNRRTTPATAADVVRVKELVWEEEEADWFSASTVFGIGYEARKTDRGAVRIRIGRGGWESFDGALEAAMAHAQSHFEAAIRSSIVGEDRT